MKGRQGKVLLVLALILLLALSVYQKQRSLPGKSAVIVDQLYRENMDFGFSGRAKALFEAHGYHVRLIEGEDVSLDFFYSTNWDVDVVILRMHSGVFDNMTWLFTHEEYDSSRHVLEQLSRETNIGRCGSVDYPVFTLSSAFFQRVMELEGGLVIVMGCNGLEQDDLVSVFHEAGAGAVVGWEGPVSVEETDEATLVFLGLLLSGKTLRESVNPTGLVFYPVDADGFKMG